MHKNYSTSAPPARRALRGEDIYGGEFTIVLDDIA